MTSLQLLSSILKFDLKAITTNPKLEPTPSPDSAPEPIPSPDPEPDLVPELNPVPALS